MVRRIVFQGVGASPGIGIGRVHVVDRRRVRYAKRRISEEQIEDEIARFFHAIEEGEEQLAGLSRRLEETILKRRPSRAPEPAAVPLDAPPVESIQADHLSILEAHRLMLRDPMLVDGTVTRVRRERLCAEWALRLTLREIKSLLDDLADDYFRERRSDVDFVGDRILRNLTGGADDVEGEVPDDAVIVAHDLSPADTLSLVRHKLAGFVTDVGGRTSHTAILARALEVPAVVAAGGVADVAGQGDQIVLDGSGGEVVLHPGRTVLARFRSLARQRALIDEELHRELHLPSVTTCGRNIALRANIEGEEELEAIIAHGAEGVGLMRTEYLFLGGRTPGTTQHRETYARVVRGLDGRPATIRTYDLGGDKLAAGAAALHETNPALGLRAIRYCLRDRALFVEQLRGILEASVFGPVQILFPMISGVAELREAKAALEETRVEMRREGVPFDENTPVGVMIELPSAVWVADFLARECDFFSVGTNDLIQYLVAADRDNEQVAYLYRPLHTAVLRALQHTARAAEEAGIRLAICGEMASEPLYTPLLLGLGFTELSMPSVAVPRVKRVVRTSAIADCQQLVEDALQLPSVQEIEALLDDRVRSRYPPGFL